MFVTEQFSWLSGNLGKINVNCWERLCKPNPCVSKRLHVRHTSHVPHFSFHATEDRGFSLRSFLVHRSRRRLRGGWRAAFDWPQIGFCKVGVENREVGVERLLWPAERADSSTDVSGTPSRQSADSIKHPSPSAPLSRRIPPAQPPRPTDLPCVCRPLNAGSLPNRGSDVVPAVHLL